MGINILSALSFAERFNRAFLYQDRYKLYFEGLGNTLTIALMATLIGVAIGIVLAMVNYINKKTGKMKLFSAAAKLYITVIRGTPVVLQLFIMYFVVLASSTNGLLIGAVTFGLNSGAYVAEIVRAGFESVDIGQMEAGRSLGMSTGQTMLKIVTPQAVKNVLPPLFNEFIMLVKETAIVGYVGIMDLGKIPGMIQSRTFDYLVPLLIAAVMYLVVVLCLTGVLRIIEKRLAKSDRDNFVKISVRKKFKIAKAKGEKQA
ncbi:MAG: amino acid ABC transporter permease [Clostridia bacterium]